MRARCGHVSSKSFAEAHYGLCRKCHSSFTHVMELEEKHGEDALVKYWYDMVIANMTGVDCIDRLIEFYQRKLAEVPSKKSYILKMLYMLHSIKEPFDAEAMA